MIETKITCDGCSEPIVGINGYPINDYIVVGKKDIPMQHTEENKFSNPQEDKM